MANSSQSDAALSLAKHLISAHAPPSNLVFSPLSLHLALAMISAGSNDPTRRQILGFLNSDHLFPQIGLLLNGGPIGGPVSLSVANGLWVDRTLNLKPAFQNHLLNSYRAVCESVDFRNGGEEARRQVNAWGERETNGLFREILPPGSVDDSTTFVLANAVYFNGTWARKFHPNFTRSLEFHLLNGRSITTSFMHTYSNEKHYFRPFDGFKVLKMPYKQGEDKATSFSMYVYLPDAIDGLQVLVERACSEAGFIDAHLPSKEVRLDRFSFPKFKVSFSFEASSVLKKMGLVLPFREGSLTEMVDSRNLLVEKIFQSSVIDVNEHGTEAAAIGALRGGGYLDKVNMEFVADHPFLFVIREDQSGVVLFVGQLLNPLQQS